MGYRRYLSCPTVPNACFLKSERQLENEQTSELSLRSEGSRRSAGLPGRRLRGCVVWILLLYAPRDSWLQIYVSGRMENLTMAV